MQRIYVELKGGIVQAVSNVPRGIEVVVMDYDNEGDKTQWSDLRGDHAALVDIHSGPFTRDYSQLDRQLEREGR